MASDDENRRELFDAFEAGLGSRGAALLMSHLPPIGWAELATKHDIAATHRDIAGPRAELKGDIAELRGEFAELRGEFRELRGEVRELRGEVRATAAELGARIDRQLPKLVVANFGSSVALVGLVLAAAKLL
jgi:hypothetical protein